MRAGGPRTQGMLVAREKVDFAKHCSGSQREIGDIVLIRYAPRPLALCCTRLAGGVGGGDILAIAGDAVPVSQIFILAIQMSIVAIFSNP